MKVSVIFLIFAILCFGAHANSVQSTSGIDPNLQNSASKIRRASPAEKSDSVGSGSLLDLGADAAESVLLPLHHIVKRGFWSNLGRSIAGGTKAVESSVKALGNIAFYKKYGYIPNQMPSQAPYGAPPSSSQESEQYGDVSAQDINSGGDYMYH